MKMKLQLARLETEFNFFLQVMKAVARAVEAAAQMFAPQIQMALPPEPP